MLKRIKISLGGTPHKELVLRALKKLGYKMEEVDTYFFDCYSKFIFCYPEVKGESWDRTSDLNTFTSNKSEEYTLAMLEHEIEQNSLGNLQPQIRTTFDEAKDIPTGMWDTSAPDFRSRMYGMFGDKPIPITSEFRPDPNIMCSCSNQISVMSEAAGKSFKYCRNCKKEIA